MINTRPRCLDEFIGQDNAKRQVITAINMAQELNQPLAPVLLTGPSGYGKTTFARLMADRAKVEFDTIYWPPRTQDALARHLVNASGIVLLDEIHRGSRSAHEWLYGVLSEGVVQYGSGYQVELEGVTIVGATTDVHQVAKPLRRRFLLELEFAPYTHGQMTLVLTGMLERAGLGRSPVAQPEEVEKLAFACGGKPGMAERLVNAAVGLTLQHGGTDAGGIFEHLEIDSDGLGSLHRTYLSALYKMARSSSQGAAGLATMAAALHVPHAAVEDIETLLSERELIVVGNAQGRVLTKTGFARAKTAKEEWDI